MRILFIGDIFGRPGRNIVRDRLPGLVAERKIDLVIANGENAAAGFGITPPIVEELLGYGIEVITTGNHVWDKREIIEFFERANGNPNAVARRVLRPANYAAGTPGFGFFEGRSRSGADFAVLNLQGRVFMANNDDPFRAADSLLASIKSKLILVDLHAEATSEKIAMGWYLDGRSSAVVGTHTHVPTADERVLPGGTAYITDLGMTGPYDSVIGIDKNIIIDRFLHGMPRKFETAERGTRLCGAIIDIDEQTGQASSITRLQVPYD